MNINNEKLTTNEKSPYNIVIRAFIITSSRGKNNYKNSTLILVYIPFGKYISIVLDFVEITG